MYWTSTVASGLTAWAPAVKPASNFLMRSISTPPMKPSLPVGEAHAAAAPTRNEPSCSANTIERTFGARAADPRSGIRRGHVDDGVDDRVQLVRVLRGRRGRGVAPQEADGRRSGRCPTKPAMRSGRSLPSCAVGSDSSVVMPKSSAALSKPAAAPSLNDLSPRPVTSNSRPTVLPAPSASAVAIGSTVPVPGWHSPVAPPRSCRRRPPSWSRHRPPSCPRRPPSSPRRLPSCRRHRRRHRCRRRRLRARGSPRARRHP